MFTMEKISNGKGKNNILKVGSKNLNSENWKVFHPNGRHMFTCGEKKAFWYLERDLAELIGEKMIQLTFDPKGNGFEDNEEFGRSVRQARCVVSGVEDNLQRHHIVPYCYRTYFPEAFKSKNHHDVVLINHEKHSEYEQHAVEYKDEIARIYGVKTIGELNVEYTARLREAGKDSSILLNSIHSLFKSYGKMPQDIKMEKLHFISKETNIPYSVIERLSYIQMYKLYQLLREQHMRDVYVFKGQNRQYYDHGYHVAKKLDTEEKIEDFVKLWRNHFIETMHPMFMPNGWSVDFRIKTKI
jgi:exonuclease 3'-5' domain-containing protein 2